MQMYNAVLEMDIQYFDGSAMITVPENTVIIVDKDLGVALVNGTHIDIFDYEYSLAC